MKQFLFSISILFLFSDHLFAQRGKQGAMTVSTSNRIVNEYVRLNANALAGSTSLTVVDNSLNANGRFPAVLAGGDLIMIIQMQGATIRGSLTGTIASPLDSTWGEILNYNNCGLYEFVQVGGVTGSTIINIDCPLKNSYTAAGRVQVVRVPRCLSLTINNTAVLTCDAWNGSIGGIVAIEVKGNTVINTGGRIDVSGKGFRAGQLDNNSTFGVNNVGSTSDTLGAEKGEGVAGYQTDYTIYGGMYCKGAAANAGGGGDAHNAGGGGGANGGNPALWNGHGNPDLSVPAWANAWDQEFVGLSTLTSSGGGKGGYTFSSNNQNATSVGPGNSSWGGDSRNDQGGFGGRPLDYSTGRLFLGGGGGAGDQNNSDGGAGGSGSGLVYLMSYGTVSGAGQILANGNNGVNACCPSVFSVTGNDGAGGGGAGGTVIVNSVGTISGISITANGGNGGNQVISPTSSITSEAEGPGGGGGGGYIAISNGTATQTANGGANGTTDSDGLLEFPPNGATKGGAGSTNQSITNLYITVASNDTVCANTSGVLTATLIGTVPSGTSINWYDSLYGGTLLGTGSPFSTAPMTASATFFVSSCPGTYRDSIRIFVGPDVSVIGSSAVCKGFSTTLNGVGATTYTWQPSTGLSNTAGSVIIASPTSFTTYTIVGTSAPLGGCTDTATFSITVNTPPLLSVSSGTVMCLGDSITTNVSGATSYLWSPSEGLSSTTGTSAIAKPTATTSYIIIGTDANGCIDTAAINIILNIPFIDAGTNDSVCLGGSVVVTANGASNYSWNTGITSPSFTITPTQTISYTVSTINGACSNSDSVTIVVHPDPVADAGIGVVIPFGSSTVLNASGGTSYQWSPSAGLSCTNCQNPTASPQDTIVYTVTVTSADGCTDIDSVTVFVDSKCEELYVPNFFSPNGDGSNDVLFVRGTCIKTLRFEVYDRWGKKVFETTDTANGWDGSYKGDKMNNAVFVFQLEAELTTGDKKSLSGNVTVVR